MKKRLAEKTILRLKKYLARLFYHLFLVKLQPKVHLLFEVEKLKIIIRDLNKDDISERKLPKNTTGVVVTEILEGSPLMFVSVNDIIVELQKKKITGPKQFSNLLKDVINKGAETLYLAIYNSSNQRSYITVKLK